MMRMDFIQDLVNHRRPKSNNDFIRKVHSLKYFEKKNQNLSTTNRLNQLSTQINDKNLHFVTA